MDGENDVFFLLILIAMQRQQRSRPSYLTQTVQSPVSSLHPKKPFSVVHFFPFLSSLSSSSLLSDRHLSFPRAQDISEMKHPSFIQSLDQGKGDIDTDRYRWIYGWMDAFEFGLKLRMSLSISEKNTEKSAFLAMVAATPSFSHPLFCALGWRRGGKGGFSCREKSRWYVDGRTDSWVLNMSPTTQNARSEVVGLRP